MKVHDIVAFAAFYDGVSVDQIMQAFHWKALNTCTSFLPKIPNLVRKRQHLGPVAAAQQVLDTSPQTSHPRK